jgi:hypothetical protein
MLSAKQESFSYISEKRHVLRVYDKPIISNQNLDNYLPGRRFTKDSRAKDEIVYINRIPGNEDGSNVTTIRQRKLKMVDPDWRRGRFWTLLARRQKNISSSIFVRNHLSHETGIGAKKHQDECKELLDHREVFKNNTEKTAFSQSKIP